MLAEELLKENLSILKESDNYGRMYNGKVEIMPLATEVLNKFGNDISLVKVGSPTVIEKNGTIAKSYSSYVIESKLEDNTIIEGFYGTVGVLVSNSQNKITVYSGANALACTNLSVFGAEYVQSMNLTQSLFTLEEILQQANISMTSRLENIKAIKEKLEAKTYGSIGFENRKGELVSRIDIGLFDYVKHAEKVLRDKNSIYSDQPYSDWLLLSAMTDKIKLESPAKRIESTLALEKLFV